MIRYAIRAARCGIRVHTVYYIYKTGTSYRIVGGGGTQNPGPHTGMMRYVAEPLESGSTSYFGVPQCTRLDIPRTLGYPNVRGYTYLVPWGTPKYDVWLNSYFGVPHSTMYYWIPTVGPPIALTLCVRIMPVCGPRICVPPPPQYGYEKPVWYI